MMLNPHEYEHEFDRSALNTINRIPLLKTLTIGEVRNFERHEKVENTGSSIKVTSTHLSNVYEILLEACENINLKTIPDTYIGRGTGPYWEINAYTLGSENPIIVISPGAVEYLTDAELLNVIGHEAGHIKSGHMLYRCMANNLSFLGTFFSEIALGIGESVNETLTKSLLYWSRMSEFTADRAGLLACQDIDVAIGVEMKLAGVPPKLYDDMDPKEFIKQAEEFNSYDEDYMLKMYKEHMNMDSSHPWSVIRAYELLKWIESGQYKHILDIHTENPELIDKICFKCGNRLDENESFCGKCGFKRWDKVCPHCGEKIQGEEAFCGICGERLWTR